MHLTNPLFNTLVATRLKESGGSVSKVVSTLGVNEQSVRSIQDMMRTDEKQKIT